MSVASDDSRNMRQICVCGAEEKFDRFIIVLCLISTRVARARAAPSVDGAKSNHRIAVLSRTRCAASRRRARRLEESGVRAMRRSRAPRTLAGFVGTRGKGDLSIAF